LHVEQGLDAVDFGRGPVGASRPRAAERPEINRLVECERFLLDRWEFDAPMAAGGDNRCHIIVVIAGAVRVEGEPSGAELTRGGTALLPAALGAVRLSPSNKTVLLDAYLP
jgi:mannose-6-phosphate isomerase class I